MATFYERRTILVSDISKKQTKTKTKQKAKSQLLHELTQLVTAMPPPNNQKARLKTQINTLKRNKSVTALSHYLCCSRIARIVRSCKTISTASVMKDCFELADSYYGFSEISIALMWRLFKATISKMFEKRLDYVE